MNRRAAFLSIVSACLAPAAWPQCRETRLDPGAQAPGDRYGQSTAIDGDVAVVGAHRADPLGSNSGAAFVFERVGLDWSLLQTLVASDGAAGDDFGQSVAVSGLRAVVGAPLYDGHGLNSGAVYVFKRGPAGWFEAAKLEASDAHPHAYFGNSVALEGDVVVVGANGGNAGAVDAGAAYVFERSITGWNEAAILSASDAEAYDNFGIDVALSGPIVVVGAFLDDHSGFHRAGSAYVFEQAGGAWSETAKLVASDPGFVHEFGTSVDVDGSTIAVGSPRQPFPGVVYVFEPTPAWSETARITPLGPTHHFGETVALEGDRLVVGALGTGSGSIPAAVDLYDRAGGAWSHWRRRAALADGSFVVDVSFGRVVVGAPIDDVAGLDAGAAFLLEYAPELGSPYCTSTPNSTGQPALIAAYGRGSLTESCLELRASPLPPGEFGYFLASRAQGFVHPLGSQGILCLSGNIGRFNRPADIIQGPMGWLAADLGSIPVNPPVAVLPGDTWSFQCWFRDRNPDPTSNFTDAVSVTFETTGDPAVQFPVTLLSQVEETVQLSVAVTLSQASSQDVTVPYTTGGTATYNVDWRVEEPNPIVIPAGETEYEMTIIVAEDMGQEGDETAVVTLGTPTGGVLGTAPEFTLTIVDDD